MTCFLRIVALLCLVLQPTAAEQWKWTGNNITDIGINSDTATTTTASFACPLPSNERVLVDNTLTMKEVVNPVLGTVTVQLTYQGEAWLGFGISDENRRMVGSDAVIGLPDEGTVQKYYLGGESVSGVVAMGQQTLLNASIVQEGDGTTILTFTKAMVEVGEPSILASGPNYFLYAVGSSNTLGLHTLEGSFEVDGLKACEVPSQTETTTDSGTTNETVATTGDEDKNNGVTSDYGEGEMNTEVEEEELSATTKRLWAVHGWLMAIAWGMLIPIGVGCSVLRKLLGTSNTWFVLHSNINSLAFLLTTISFAIAVYNIQEAQEDHFIGNKHEFIGLLMMIFVFIQVASGWLRPHLSNEDRGQAPVTKVEGEEASEEGDDLDTPQKSEHGKTFARKWFEIQHRVLGTGLLGLSWYQCILGLEIYEEDIGITFPAEKIFWAVVGTITGVIIFTRTGLFFRG
jgi:hypothetical protein